MAEAHSPDHLRLDATVARLKQQGQAGIDLSLDRLRRALEGLGAPQTRLPPVIHVAGTNGKGSVCAFLRAGLEAMGLTVHAYTSPHLLSFTERFRVAGDLIAPDRLADLLESLSEPAGTLALPPLSFFERSTAAAFVAFSSISADVTLLEVGMGGRDDATNVIPDPAVSVITPVGLDHCGFLGPDL
ncbi:MAG: bifunctional folylpolyglutamate synthase/dihydrofolate synthase, partial [Rhodospirillaceae bacterium]